MFSTTAATHPVIKFGIHWDQSEHDLCNLPADLVTRKQLLICQWIHVGARVDLSFFSLANWATAQLLPIKSLSTEARAHPRTWCSRQNSHHGNLAKADKNTAACLIVGSGLVNSRLHRIISLLLPLPSHRSLQPMHSSISKERDLVIEPIV